jgi:hypothetical protein
VSFEQNNQVPEGRKFIKDKPLAASFSILCVLRGVHSKVCLSSRTEPHEGTILNSKVYCTNGSEIDLDEYKENRMDSGGKRGSQKSCANMKIMTSSTLL